MNMNAKVVKLNENSVYDEFKHFINLAHHSENTKLAYEKGIRDFFQFHLGKDLEFLTWEDVKIKKRDVEKFRTELKSQGLTNTTINNKIAGLRKFYIELSANDYDVKADFFRAIKALGNDTKSYGFFTIEEALSLASWAEQEKHNGKVKSLFLLFCLDTCIRKDAALNLKWNDFQVINETEVQINAIDKGNKDFRAKIHRAFYDQLLTIKTDSERVFNVTKSSIDAMMPRLIKKLNTNPQRNLTFHSLRKTGVEFKYRYTGDIKVAQKAANHEDSSLTFNTYIDTEDYGVLGAISLNYNQDKNILDELSNEQLRELLDGLDNDLLLRLNKIAKEKFR